MAISWSALAPKLVTVTGVIALVAALHFGQALFVPLAFAMLLALILSPLAVLGELVLPHRGRGHDARGKVPGIPVERP